MQLFVKKAAGGLYPLPESNDDFLRLKGNVVLTCEVKQPRNPRHHRLFFSLLQKIFHNQEHYQTIRALRTHLLIALGRCEVTQGKDGTIGFTPHSISFGSMDQTEFDQFWEEVLELVVTKYLPGVKKAELRKEIETMIGD